MDRACWITWYNLPAEGRDAYLSWLHDAYIPRVVERPGILWGAHYASEANVVPLGGGKGRVRHTDGGDRPAGVRYILLFGAEEPDAFTRPTPNRFHAGLDERDRRMLGIRQGERVTIKGFPAASRAWPPIRYTSTGRVTEVRHDTRTFHVAIESGFALGGSSGSPVLAPDGRVLGIVYAGVGVAGRTAGESVAAVFAATAREGCPPPRS